ncbi:MAG: hypothetical protein AAF585_17965 [Verrucomicrobiota bacterium]
MIPSKKARGRSLLRPSKNEERSKMGTSRSTPPVPKWANVKSAVSTALNNGPVNREEAHKLLGKFVQQFCDTGEDDAVGSPDGSEVPTPEEAAKQLERLVLKYPKSPSPGAGRGEGGGGGGGGGTSAAQKGAPKGGRSRRGGAGGAKGGGAVIGRGVRPTAQRVATFLSDVRKVGLTQALAERGVTDSSSIPPEQLAVAIADVIGENSTHIIDSELRDALSRAFEKICERQDTLEAAELAIDQAADNICSVLTELFECYILERFKTIHAEHLAEDHDFEAADRIVNEARHYVASELELEQAKGRDLTEVDWAGSEGGEIIDAILDRTVAIYIDAEEDGE